MGGGGVSNSTFDELEDCRRGGVARIKLGSGGGGGQGVGDESEDERRARGCCGPDSRRSSADDMGRMVGMLMGSGEGGSSSLAVWWKSTRI